MNGFAINENSEKFDLQKIETFLTEKSTEDSKIVVMTIGNVLLSDDGIGPMVYDQLSAWRRSFPSILLINAELNPENYLKTVLDFKPTHIIFVDSIQAGLKPGTICFFKKEEIDDSLSTQSSTHMISIFNLIDYLKKRDNTINFLNIGIQIKSSDFGLQKIDFDVYESGIQLADYLVKILIKLFKNPRSV
jgi:hydrogenase maturation protease